MKDSDIHRNELLLTLYYLLNRTDEDHPAKILDICKSADVLGLFYDPELEGKSGNDVKRQRVSETLKYLYDTVNSYPDAFPFKMEQTDGGKFYAVKKQPLSENDVLNIITCIRDNNNFTREKTKQLTVKLIHEYIPENKQKEIGEKLITHGVAVRPTRPNYELLSDAYYDKQVVKAKTKTYTVDESGSLLEKNIVQLYRVIEIRRLKGKPYAYLLPLSGPGMLCVATDELEIIETNIDPFAKKSSDALLQSNNPTLRKDGVTVEEFIRKMQIPGLDFKDIVVHMYFPTANLDLVAKAYTEYFAESLYMVKQCNITDINIIDRDDDHCGYDIKSDPNGNIYITTFKTEFDAFIKWLMTPIGPSMMTPMELVKIVNKSVKDAIKARYLSLARKCN